MESADDFHKEDLGSVKSVARVRRLSELLCLSLTAKENILKVEAGKCDKRHTAVEIYISVEICKPMILTDGGCTHKHSQAASHNPNSVLWQV